MSTQVNTSKVVDEAVQKITDGYELDEEFVNSARNTLTEVLGKLYIYDKPQNVADSGATPAKAVVVVEKKKKKEKSEKKKPSAYNLFLQEKMKELHDVPGGEKMSKVGQLWKALNAEQKAVYQKRSDDLSAPDSAAAAAAPKAE